MPGVTISGSWELGNSRKEAKEANSNSVSLAEAPMTVQVLIPVPGMSNTCHGAPVSRRDPLEPSAACSINPDPNTVRKPWAAQHMVKGLHKTHL